MTATAHAELMSQLEEQFRPLLESSPDGVYLWLDETHKICNARLAELFGYTVAEEWAPSPASWRRSWTGPTSRCTPGTIRTG